MSCHAHLLLLQVHQCSHFRATDGVENVCQRRLQLLCVVIVRPQPHNKWAHLLPRYILVTITGWVRDSLEEEEEREGVEVEKEEKEEEEEEEEDREGVEVEKEEKEEKDDDGEKKQRKCKLPA